MSYLERNIAELTAAVERVSPPDLLKELEPWEILAHAALHLCAHVMEAGDIHAWWMLKDQAAELIARPDEYTILDKIRDEALGD